MMGPLYLSIVALIVFNISPTTQNSRTKRQASSEPARILTDNGHLIFQTGVNHNITFQSSGGGFVNVDGENFKNIVDTVKSNKRDIDRLKNSQNSNDVSSRLSNVESRLDSLRPTGEVANKLNLLTSQLNDLTNRVSSIESTLNNEDNDQLRRVRGKVNRLEDEVNELKRQLEVDNCSSSPCRNGGSCVDMFNGFLCRCPNNWQGTTCEDDVNECIVYAGTGLGCQNQATCINTQGSYRCQCTANYRGIRCTETHDDCTGASNEALCGQGTCVNQARHNPNDPKYTCICNDGWTTNGQDPACNVDINECQALRSPCSADPAVTCINVPGSFYCGACPAGFSGNGYVCTDINECEVNNGGCSLNPRVSCTNSPGSRQCGSCPPGYRGNGVTCDYIGICNRNNGGCHSHAICQEVPNIERRICRCAPGYVGDGEGMSGCIPTQGGCTPDPCFHGNCTASGTSFVCSCEDGWAGSTCNEDINECLSQPCLNNGTCFNQMPGFSCTYTDDFTGPTCEDEVASKSFKVATKLDGKLQLNCNELQQISNIQNRTLCEELAKSHESANSLSFDETNKKCSVQQCSQNINIPVIAVPSARISIMFESAFYPRTCIGRVLVSDNRKVITTCATVGPTFGSLDACVQSLCNSDDHHAANYEHNRCNVKKCSNALTISGYDASYRVLYKIPKLINC